jgi:hypothetical protein
MHFLVLKQFLKNLKIPKAEYNFPSCTLQKTSLTEDKIYIKFQPQKTSPKLSCCPASK